MFCLLVGFVLIGFDSFFFCVISIDFFVVKSELFRYFSVCMFCFDKHIIPDFQIITGYKRNMSTGILLIYLKCHQVFVLRHLQL